MFDARNCSSVGLVLLATAMVSVTAQAPTLAAEFFGLGELPSGVTPFSVATDVSADGSVVVGYDRRSYATINQRLYWEAFRWTRETGMVGLGPVAGEGGWSAGSAVSADGNVVVGRGGFADGSSLSAAFRWSSEDGMQTLSGPLPDPSWFKRIPEAFAVSHDGSAVLGRDWDYGPLYWTQETGRVPFDDLCPESPDGWVAFGGDLSDDGNVVVGSCGISATPMDGAFAWSSDTGKVLLGDLPGGTYDSHASAISPDGEAIIGTSHSFRGVEPFRWTEAEGMTGLGLPEGTIARRGVAASLNGAVILGNFPPEPREGVDPFIWDELHGWRDLRSVFEDEYGLGPMLEGWELSGPWNFGYAGAVAISDDAMTIVGTGINPDGHTEAWIAILDASLRPGDFDGNGLLDIEDVDGLTREIAHATHNTLYDVNEDGLVETKDLRTWIKTLRKTWFGDANLDGEFNSGDLVDVFQAAQYEDGLNGNSTWSTGDWDADGDFTTRDLVTAFQDGGFEAGKMSTVAFVPEPSGWLMLLFGCSILIRAGRSRLLRSLEQRYLQG